MNYLAIGVALMAVSAAATAQDSAWGYFEGENGVLGAGVQAADGSQLILKCDKPGKREVFATVVARSNLVAPLPDDKFESHPVRLRMDENAPWDDNWRFNDRFAMAVDQGNERSLTRLLEKLDDASKVQVQLKPLKRSPTVIDFDVAGAHEAIGRVYESCKDDNPVG